MIKIQRIVRARGHIIPHHPLREWKTFCLLAMKYKKVIKAYRRV
jgi:hypothetical protein